MRLPLFLALSLTSLLSYATDTSASRGVELEQMKASGSSITGWNSTASRSRRASEA